MENLALYDYELPEELIAKEPLAQRDRSRLLVVDRATGQIAHHTFRDLPDLLRSGDCLVLNDSRVIPARLIGHRTATGGKWEGLYLGSPEAGTWRLIGQTRGTLKAGEQISICPAHDPDSKRELRLTLRAREADGIWLADVDAGNVDADTFDAANNVLDLLQQFGTVPLPPYIRRQLATSDDWQRYQTTYARNPGSVAAPTAGLHFTPEVLETCKQAGIPNTSVTLHVGIGTFRPIAVEKLGEHQMHSEWCELSTQTVDQLEQTRAQGGRIVAVGTTSVRTLESAAQAKSLKVWSGETNLFIRPPYNFHAVDVLLTNFHPPRSTLFVLACTFAGTDLLKDAYATAIANNYRFYSYGDAMLIL